MNRDWNKIEHNSPNLSAMNSCTVDCWH